MSAPIPCRNFGNQSGQRGQDPEASLPATISTGCRGAAADLHRKRNLREIQVCALSCKFSPEEGLCLMVWTTSVPLGTKHPTRSTALSTNPPPPLPRRSMTIPFSPLSSLNFFKDTANLSRCLIDKACKTEIADAVYYGVISHARFLHFLPSLSRMSEDRISDIRAFHCDTNLGSGTPFSSLVTKSLSFFSTSVVSTRMIWSPRTQSSFGSRTPSIGCDMKELPLRCII